MDLADVLACGTDGLGHPVIARYFDRLFERYLPTPDYTGAFRVRAALNFGVQQLATRSRVSPDTERYLQVGGFDAHDLPAALIEAMPHTTVFYRRPADGCAAALAATRAKLPNDAFPTIVALTPDDTPDARFGLIAMFAEGPVPDVTAFMRRLSPRGRLLLVWRATADIAPALSLHA